MSNGNLVPKSFFRIPSINFPTWIEDIEDMLPMNNRIDGLSLSEDEKNVYVEAAVPGIDPNEVEVTFDQGVLTVRGEKKEEEKGKTFQKRATSSFFYRVAPGDVDLKAEPEAVCKNGMMRITLPKKPETTPKRIKVKSG